MGIEPQRLTFVKEPGLDATPMAGAVGPGIWVVIGPNNAGKTRALRAIERSGFAAHVKLSDHPKSAAFNHAGVDALWLDLELDVSWPRGLDQAPAAYHVGQVPGLP